MMKLFIQLIILMLLCSLANAQQIPAHLLDSISIVGNNGSYPNLDGVTITQRGKLIFENYFHGLNKESLHDSRSSFKSITGILVGIAIDKGFIKNVPESTV